MIRSALITGASSGIGAATAQALAQPGAYLHLSGRDAARLEAVAAACRAKGALTETRVIDVRDEAAMHAWITGAGKLDFVLANAGISAGTGRSQHETAAQARAIFAVNLNGVLNTVLPALQAMAGQPPGGDGVRGRIGVVASVAAFVPAPGAPSYCASKAAADAWTIATAPSARAQGVVLSSICPGYVRTAMTAKNRFPMPGLMDAERAAGIILRGMLANRRRIGFPWWMILASRLTGQLPPAVSTWLLGRAEGKDALSAAD